jgi:two-component system, response regulator YesN
MANKILLVDDDSEFRAEMKEFLDGYEVIEAFDGREALRVLKRANEIVLVILDIQMPGPSGIDVLREIKKIDPHLGIVILTGYSTKDLAIEALKAHADDYIEKPMDINKVKGIIHKVITMKQPRSSIDTTTIKGKIEQVKNFIAINCFKKTSLSDAAEAVCLSPKYLSRIFMQHTGESFSAHKLKIKISKAKELLGAGGLNINQISDKLGYENAESFIRQFKKLTRLTPTQYRAKAQTPKARRKKTSR